MSDGVTKYTCKKCGSALVRKPKQFYYRGTWCSGLVCVSCNALRADPEDDIFKMMAKDA